MSARRDEGFDVGGTRVQAYKSLEGSWPEPFLMTSGGLYYQPPKRDDATPERVWLASPFDVAFEVRSVDGGPPEPGLLLRIPNRDGAPHEVVVLRSELQTDGAEVRKRLAALGLSIVTSKHGRERFTAALNAVAAFERAWHTKSSGWKREGKQFVLPGRPIGGDGEPVFYLGRPEGAHYGAGGTFDAWKTDVAAQCLGNPILLFSVCLALSGVLLKPLRAEGGGVHFVGPSSSGKSTALWGAASVWGPGGPNGFATTWRATGNALEGVASARNHTLLALDEMGRCDPDELGKAFYGLSDGQGKERMRADSSLRQRAEWLLAILSTGEVSIEQALNEGRKRSPVRAGQEVRIVTIDVERGRGAGVIDDLRGASSSSAFAEAYRRATTAHFGHAGPAFVEALIAQPDLLDRAQALVDAFRRRVLVETDTGQVQRASMKFGLPAAAGELAIELGLVPWPPGSASDAAASLFDFWAVGFGRSVEREQRAAVEQVRYMIATHGATAFWWLNEEREDEADAEPGNGGRKGEGRTTFQMGWKYRHKEEGLLYLIDPRVMERNVAPGRDGRAVARALRNAGFLVVGRADGLTYRARVGGLRPHLYAVSARIIEGEGDDGDADEA
jgi:putative DNA primase/helicase